MDGHAAPSTQHGADAAGAPSACTRSCSEAVTLDLPFNRLAVFKPCSLHHKLPLVQATISPLAQAATAVHCRRPCKSERQGWYSRVGWPILPARLPSTSSKHPADGFTPGLRVSPQSATCPMFFPVFHIAESTATAKQLYICHGANGCSETAVHWALLPRPTLTCAHTARAEATRPSRSSRRGTGGGRAAQPHRAPAVCQLAQRIPLVERLLPGSGVHGRVGAGHI